MYYIVSVYLLIRSLAEHMKEHMREEAKEDRKLKRAARAAQSSKQRSKQVVDGEGTVTDTIDMQQTPSRASGRIKERQKREGR